MLLASKAMEVLALDTSKDGKMWGKMGGKWEGLEGLEAHVFRVFSDFSLAF